MDSFWKLLDKFVANEGRNYLRIFIFPPVFQNIDLLRHISHLLLLTADNLILRRAACHPVELCFPEAFIILEVLGCTWRVVLHVSFDGAYRDITSPFVAQIATHKVVSFFSRIEVISHDYLLFARGRLAQLKPTNKSVWNCKPLALFWEPKWINWTFRVLKTTHLNWREWRVLKLKF